MAVLLVPLWFGRNRSIGGKQYAAARMDVHRGPAGETHNSSLNLAVGRLSLPFLGEERRDRLVQRFRLAFLSESPSFGIDLSCQIPMACDFHAEDLPKQNPHPCGYHHVAQHEIRAVTR